MLRRALLTGIVSALLLPAAAHAGVIVANVSIQGAGSMGATWSTGGAGCVSQTFTNNGVQFCGQLVDNLNPFGTSQMVLTAAPRPTGGWAFVGWSGCQGGVTSNPCVLTANAFATLPVSPTAVFIDLTPPVVAGLTHDFPAGNSQVRFTWGVDDPATFQCKVDTGAFSACTSGKTYTLGEGNHTLTLRPTDLAGNTAGDLMNSVRVLDTILVSGAKSFERVRTASFKFRSISGVRFDCRLVKPGQPAPAFADCGAKNPGDNTLMIPFNAADLAQDGAYTFQARATDGGDLDQTPLSRTWTIDTAPPNTTLTSPDLPEGVVTTLLDAAFTFASTEPGTLQCSADGAAFSACTSPRTLPNLAFGSHTFAVRGVDRAGNIDATPAVRHWTVAAQDNDGDGFNQRSDCDDSDAAVHPTARDIPANGKDEDCDGKDAPRPAVQATVAHGWSVLHSDVTLTRLLVKKLARNAKVEVRCLGGGCPFKRLNAKGKPRNGTLNLMKTLKGDRHEFRAGQTLEIRITARRFIGKVMRFKLRAGKLPVARELCLPPGAKKPRKRC
jgi:hypothetical protein